MKSSERKDSSTLTWQDIAQSRDDASKQDRIKASRHVTSTEKSASNIPVIVPWRHDFSASFNELEREIPEPIMSDPAMGMHQLLIPRY